MATHGLFAEGSLVVGHENMMAKASQNPLAFVQGMLGCLYCNPRGYVQTVGELNALLWFVHHLWAGIADREAEFLDVRCNLYNQEFADEVECMRSQPISDLEACRTVAGLWKQIDSALGLHAAPLDFDQFISQ